MYVGYLLFHIELAGMLTCIIAAFRLLFRRDWENMGVALIVFLMCLIGASNDYVHYMFMVATRYNINLFP